MIVIDSFLHLTNNQLIISIIGILFFGGITYFTSKSLKDGLAIDLTITFSFFICFLFIIFLFVKSVYLNNMLVNDFEQINKNNVLNITYNENKDKNNDGYALIEISEEKFIYKSNKKEVYYIINYIDSNKIKLVKTDDEKLIKFMNKNKNALLDSNGNLKKIGE